MSRDTLLPVLRAARERWALPPAPPEQWVGERWSLALVAALAVAVVVPLYGVLDERTGRELALAVGHVTAGCAAALAGYVLLVQSSVTGDPRLRWAAAGYAAVWPLVLMRSVGWDPAVTLVWLAAVPLLTLTAGLAWRRPHAVVAPLLALVVAAGTALTADGTSALVAGSVAAAAGVAALVAAVAQPHATWWWVAVGLALTLAAASTLATEPQVRSDRWWAAQVLLVLALAVPAAGLALVSAAGYRRQSRRWRRLVQEVGSLRAASPLLPGLSVSPEDDEGMPEEREVRALIRAGHLQVALQPVVDLAGGAVVGFEALSRFGGRVPTDRWFRSANRTGLGGELERVTLDAALQLLPGLAPEAFLAVNVSPVALEDEQVVGRLTAVDLSRVVVELTEHEAVSDYTGVRAVLARLREQGARIAVDDTGAGFSSLRHVLMLQPDIVKLDSSLSRDVHHSERQRQLVRALLTFAAEVGSVVLAEGIETEEQLDALRDLGVPLGQGWYLGVPTVVE